MREGRPHGRGTRHGAESDLRHVPIRLLYEATSKDVGHQGASLPMLTAMPLQGRTDMLGKSITFTAYVIAAAFVLAISAPTSAKVEGDTITLGVVTSLTGKYSINGNIAVPE